MLYWIIGIVLILGASAAAFVFLARKGRKLRTTRQLPAESTVAMMEDGEGRQYSIESGTHFYMGTNPENDVVLAQGKQEYTVCIFYHRRRFAFQTYSGSYGIRVNGEEQLAGYLANGDVLEIAGETFIFRCR